MNKKNLNQNTKFIQKLINTFEPDFIFVKNQSIGLSYTKHSTK